MNFIITLYLSGVALIAFGGFSDAVPLVSFNKSNRHVRVNKELLQAQTEQRESKMNTFKVIDEDANGKIDVDEWVGAGGNQEDFVDLLIDVDTNHDNMVSRREFLRTNIEHVSSSKNRSANRRPTDHLLEELGLQLQGPVV